MPRGCWAACARDMILLADRNLGSGALAAGIAGARAEFLVRVQDRDGAPGPARARRCRDGS